MMNKNKLAIAALILVAVGLSASTVFSQTKSILKLAEEYSNALRKYQKQTSRSSVESLVRKGTILSRHLDKLENLSVEDYELFEKKMKGFVVNREEVVFVEPDLKFFAALSRTKGVSSDVAYFALMQQIKPDSIWAAYTDQQTDYSGCTIYGNGLLTKLYGKALNFKSKYPKAFSAEINEEIKGILEPLTDGDCACGNRVDVIKEFRLFIKTFPKDKNTPKIRKRLAIIQKDKDFRFNCQSG